MKYLFAAGTIVATVAAAGSLAHAQPVENTRPPLFANQQSYYGDTSQTAPEVTGRNGQDRRGSGYWMYDSHNPEANSARWGVGN